MRRIVRWGFPIAAAAVLALGGCEDDGGTGDAMSVADAGDAGDAGGDTSCPADRPDEADLPAAWRTCEDAADCVLVTYGCCDPCNGGEQTAVTAAHQADAEALLAWPACACSSECTLLGCQPHVPTCEGGVCGHEPDPAWLGCAGLSEAACTPSCHAFAGWPTDDPCTPETTGDPTFVACGPDPGGATGAITCGAKGADRAWFPSGALPPGYTACDTSACP